MRLPQKLRLKESRDFARVRQEGTSFPGRCLVLSVLRLPVEKVPTFQFGIITGKKLGKAVVRVRTRRRLREIIRDTNTFSLMVCISSLFPAGALRRPVPKIARDFIHTAKKAGILRAP